MIVAIVQGAPLNGIASIPTGRLVHVLKIHFKKKRTYSRKLWIGGNSQTTNRTHSASFSAKQTFWKTRFYLYSKITAKK